MKKLQLNGLHLGNESLLSAKEKQYIIGGNGAYPPCSVGCGVNEVCIFSSCYDCQEIREGLFPEWSHLCAKGRG